MAAVVPHPEGQPVPHQPEARLGFGYIKSRGRVIPIPATREILALLEDIARKASSSVKGLEPLFTDAELAGLFKVDQRTIRRWVQRRWLGYVDLGEGAKQLRRYPLTWVKRLIDDRFQPPSVNSGNR